MFELGFHIAADAWDEALSILENHEALAITQSDGNGHVFSDNEKFSIGSWTDYKVSALFAERAVAADACRQLKEQTNIDDWTIESVGQEDWSEAWRHSWQPIFFSGGLCVHPSWIQPTVPGKKVVFIDPGMAFGTGTHETTSLCLDWIGENPVDGKTLVDWGCGTGILGLAAAALGAQKVCSFDNDNLARSVAQQNVIKNDLAQIVEISATPPCLPADILVANILLGPLLNLRESFLGSLCQGGRLLLAGILVTQAETLRLAYEPIRLDIIGQKGEWVLLEGEV